MKQLILSVISLLVFGAAFAQNPINLDIQVVGPDPCTGEYTFLNNSTGTAVTAGTVTYYWSGPWSTTVETTDLSSPPDVTIPETANCQVQGVICYGEDYTVVAIDNVTQTAVAVNVADALPQYDPPGSCITMTLVNASEDSVFCVGDTLIFTAGTAGSFYDDFNWDASDLGTIVSGQGTNTLVVVVTSTDGGKVVVTDAAGCGVSTFMVLDSKDCCTPVSAEFTYIQPDLCVPVIEFEDLSTGIISSWEWHFGDGHSLASNGHAGTDPITTADNNGGLTSGTYANPVHDYSTLVGPYSIDIQLVIFGYNQCSASAEIIFDNYFGGSGPVTADFEYYKADPCSPIVEFTDESTGIVVEWNWDFGDGYSLHSNGHLGTDLVVFPDDNGGLTSGTYANPIHSYSTLTGPIGMNVELVVSSANMCSVAGVIANDLDFYSDCCEDGIIGLKDYAYLHYGIYNSQDVYDLTASNTCAYNPSALNRGGSTIDTEGNYYYVDGSAVVLQERNGNCATMTFTAPAGWTEISEPEYVAGSNSVVFVAHNGTEYVLAEMGAPALLGTLTTPMNIVQTISLGAIKPAAGSSTLNEDGATVEYYFMNNAYNPTSLDDAGDLYTVDVANGNVSFHQILDMDAYDQPNSNVLSASNTSIVEELEYNPNNGRIYGVITHVINVGTGNLGGTLPGGPIGNGPGGEIDLPGGGNQPHLNNTAILVNTRDIVEINLNSGHATIHVEDISYDNLSSSTFDATTNTYYLTANNGALMYIADLSAQSYTTQFSTSTDPKDPTTIFEIEFFGCPENNGARLMSEETHSLPKTIVVSPNPSATGLFTVELQDANTETLGQLEVMDQFGSVVYKADVSDQRTQIDLSEFARGIYYVRTLGSEGTEVTRIVFE